MNSSVVAVIPARGGSKGIPQKNTRLLHGKPLISYAIETAKETDYISDVVVTTDSEEIAHIAERFGCDLVIDRPTELAEDDVPLAPVIAHAYQKIPRDVEYVLCLQPTAPLISPKSIEDAIIKTVEKDVESTVFVRDSTHQYWAETEDSFVKFPKDRKNRQKMETVYEEVGIFLTDCDTIRDGKRVGANPLLHPVPHSEGIDIDTYSDWVLAENELQRGRIVYRLIGDEETGLGHVYRGLSLAKRIFEMDLLFVVPNDHQIAQNLISRRNYPLRTIQSESEFIDILSEEPIDILVNDILDTDVEYMREVSESVNRVVNIEDIGPGASYADAVINALYEFSQPPQNHYHGAEFVCLRDEFLYANSHSSIEGLNQLMVSFGGTDQNNLTRWSIETIAEFVEVDLILDIVIGPGYKHRDSLQRTLSNLPENIQYTLSQDVNRMSDHMEDADLMLTSNGRTVYESAALNLPTITISQNQRETKHVFSDVCLGINNLGSAGEVGRAELAEAVLNYADSSELRNQMCAALKRYNLKKGINTVKGIILNGDKYDEPTTGRYPSR